jgi:hypothetical protein
MVRLREYTFIPQLPQGAGAWAAFTMTNLAKVVQG